MPVAKVKCSQCREYFPREEMYRTNLGLGGICSEHCYRLYLDKQRQKKAQRNGNGKRRSGTKRSRVPGSARDRVRKRDDEKCRLCFRDITLNIHHVRYRSEGGPDTPRNLITLCLEHHDMVHGNKRLYQPALMLWLWLYYDQGEEVSLQSAIDMVVANSHSEWVDRAAEFAGKFTSR